MTTGRTQILTTPRQLPIIASHRHRHALTVLAGETCWKKSSSQWFGKYKAKLFLENNFSSFSPHIPVMTERKNTAKDPVHCFYLTHINHSSFHRGAALSGFTKKIPHDRWHGRDAQMGNSLIWCISVIAFCLAGRDIELWIWKPVYILSVLSSWPSLLLCVM